MLHLSLKDRKNINYMELRVQESDGVTCWMAEQVTVCTDMLEVSKKIPIPDWMREGLEKMFPQGLILRPFF